MRSCVCFDACAQVTSKPCKVCSKLFATPSGLDLHVSSGKCNQNQGSQESSVKADGLSDDSALSHENAHDGEIVSCPVCADEFLSQKGLSLHLAAMPRVHGSARRCVCVANVLVYSVLQDVPHGERNHAVKLLPDMLKRQTLQNNCI